MEKINIAELLKDCPQGMELYSPIFGKVYLDKIRPHLAIVVTIDKEQGDFKEEFLYDGRYGMNGECMLFPSRDKTTWEGFHRPFRDGDIVTWDNRGLLVACIYKERKNTTSFYHHIALYKGGLGIVVNGEIMLSDAELSFATEEEKQKLFDAIKVNGYKWNSETKTLEKLIEPKFKVGDKIKHKTDRWSANRTIKHYNKDIGYYTTINDWVRIEDQDDWELVPNKFDITTLKPFDKVLIRDTNGQVWTADLFSHIINKNPNLKITFVCVGHYPNQCIPYKGNEYLLGTSNDCDNFYKTW